MRTWMVGTAVAGVALLAAPEPARACGGFFCSSAPMDQSGEKIVFSVEDDGTTTTHVQILYQGTAESFAWILPVPSVPELSVGTDLLFQQLEAATAPRFQLDYEATGTCRTRPSCPAAGGPDAGSIWLSDGGASDASAGFDAGGSVEVHFRDAVGPYDAAVIGSDDAMELRTWLADSGYDIPEASLPLIDDYVAKGDVFVALKLLTDRSAGEIQPIVLRYEERQPCIPIRLTAIAAVPDMPITAWVLADRRAAPYNYMSILPPVNDRRLFMGGIAYAGLVARAVDDAGGRAFVTDYAGRVPSLGIAAPSVEDLRTVTDPADILRELRLRGFNADAQLLGVLLRHIPPPDGVVPQDFYNCLVNDWCDAHDTYIEELVFDPSAFVDDLNAAIVTPRAEAKAMLERHTKLTRLFTTMSAEDMTEDPVFFLSESMPDVSNIHTATLVTECGPEYFFDQAPQKLVLPNGGEETVRVGTRYTGTDDEYCMERTGFDASGRPPSGDGSDAGGGCAATRVSAAPLWGLATAILALGLTRRRRRRRRSGQPR